MFFTQLFQIICSHSANDEFNVKFSFFKLIRNFESSINMVNNASDCATLLDFGTCLLISQLMYFNYCMRDYLTITWCTVPLFY